MTQNRISLLSKPCLAYSRLEEPVIMFAGIVADYLNSAAHGQPVCCDAYPVHGCSSPRFRFGSSRGISRNRRPERSSVSCMLWCEFVPCRLAMGLAVAYGRCTPPARSLLSAVDRFHQPEPGCCGCWD